MLEAITTRRLTRALLQLTLLSVGIVAAARDAGLRESWSIATCCRGPSISRG